MIFSNQSQHLRVTKIVRRAGIWQRGLLSGSALGGGVIALMVTMSPQSALANCVMTTISGLTPNSLTCSNTTTSDTTRTTFSGSATNRHYQFTSAGDVIPNLLNSQTVQTGTLITGYGLAVESTSAGSAVTVENAGAIRLTSGVPTVGITGGAAALNIISNGGNITYLGNGTAIANGFAANGLTISSSGGLIKVGDSPVTPGFIGSSGFTTTSGAGAQVVEFDAGFVTATAPAGSGIAMNSTSGTMTLTTTGGTLIGNASGAVNNVTGINMNSATGNIKVTTDANIGGPAVVFDNEGGFVTVAGSPMRIGINAATAGNIEIQLKAAQGAGIINVATGSDGLNPPGALSPIGINAVGSGAGSISVTTDAGTTIQVTGAGGIGINAVSNATGTGAITVVTNGTIGAPPPAGNPPTPFSPPDVGVNMQILNAANTSSISYTNGVNGNITANNIGVNATTAGTGNVVIVNQGVITQTTLVNPTDSGINAAATSGLISINSAGAVNSINDAIRATTSAGGSIDITTGATAIKGDTDGGGNGAAIVAAATGGNGNVSIVTGTGLVSGNTPVTGPNGVISASAVGTGTVTVTVGAGGVTSLGTGAFGTASGIATSAANGQTTITTNGLVTATAGTATSGINAKSTGTGGITINANANVSANLHGIATSAVNGATSITTAVGTAITGGISNANPGDAIHVETTGTGNVTIFTHGTVTGNVLVPGSDGISVTGGGSGDTLIHTFAAVTGDPAIIVNMAGNVDIITDAASPTTGATTAISGTTTGTNTHVLVDVSAAVTGQAGNGIATSSVNGLNTVNVRQGVTVTGTGAASSGISAATTNGVITVNVGPLATVTSADPSATGSGRAVTLDTSAGTTGSATLNNDGTLIARGSVTDAMIRILNNNGPNAITINNNSDGIIRNGANTASGWAVTTSLDGTNFSPNTQSVIVNNAGLINGRVFMGSGADQFNNKGVGVWNVSGGTTATASGPASQFGNGSSITNASAATINIGAGSANFTGFLFSNTGLQTGTNTISNSGLVNSAGNVNFQFTGANAQTVINNNGLNGANGNFNVGSVAGSAESTSFSSAGTQTVNNTGAFNIIGHGTGTAAIGTVAATAAGPTGVGALNFTGANGSNFNNAGGLINMQADNGSTTNAVTFNTTALGGTSDLDYTYAFTGNTYNFNGGTLGGAPSLLRTDTFLGGPGSTSDRLVVGGDVTGNTLVQVNDTNPGAGSLNTVGITVVAVQGGGSDNFKVDPTNPKYLDFGPLGAIDKGFFVYPLLYTPGAGGAPNSYRFYGLPGPFGFNLPVAATAAQSIWEETAMGWEDRQDQVRNCMARGIIAQRQAWGSGADLPPPAVKAPLLPPLPDCSGGIWTKIIGSYTRRNGTADLAAQFNNPAFAGLSWDNNYRQTTLGTISGFDFGKSELTGPFDSIKFSLMGGYLTSFVDFNSPNDFTGPATFTSYTYRGGTVGGSITYMNRGFFIDALGKADFLTLAVGGIPGEFCTVAQLGGVCSKNVNSVTYGVLGNIGNRFEFGRYFIEPVASVLWANTKIDDLALEGAGVTAHFGNNDVLKVGGGFRTGGVLMDDRVHYLEGSVQARVWDRVSGDNGVDFFNAGPTFRLTDAFPHKFYGETAVQLDWISRTSGWSAYMKGNTKFNQDFVTVTGATGVRYQF